MAMERIARAVKRSWKGWVWGKENALQVLGARNAAAAAEGNAPSVQKDAKKPTQTAKPYSLFVKDRFQVVRREHPLDDFQTTASRLGELWRKMDRVEKERYARLARIGWEKQAALWASAHPKRKPSAYANFVKTEMPRLKQAHPEATFAELSRLCGQHWSAMTPAQRHLHVD